MIGRLLGHHLRMLVASASQLTAEEAEGVVRGFLLVMEGSRIEGAEATVGTGLRATARTRAEGFIRAHLHDADLSAGTVARACGLSRAALYRLFTADGGVRRFIQRERLDLAPEPAGKRPAIDAGAMADVCGGHGAGVATDGPSPEPRLATRRRIRDLA